MVRMVALFSVVILSTLCMLARAAASDGESNASPELVVDVDVNDEVWMRGRPMTERDVSELVSQLRQSGCKTLLVRCGCLGLLPYRTRLSYPMEFDADHARSTPVPGMISNMETYIAQRTTWTRRYAEVIRSFNPPEVFFREAHKQGMKVIAWIDLFDDLWPGYRSKFLDEHPHCQWVGKDGTTYFRGLIDYAWSEARSFRVAQAKELLDWGADGIHCSTSAHCRHLGNRHQEDFYGYSRPVVERFLTTYGGDIRTAERFDKAAWHDLKGEFMVQLYRDLAQLCHQRGKELWIGQQLGRYTQFAVDPHFSTNVVARYSNHWKTLVDQRIADAFILGDYEIASSSNAEYWSAKKDIQRRSGESLFAWMAREYQPACKGKTRLYLFSEWLPDDSPGLNQRLSFWADVACDNRFDGLDVHEAWNLEASPHGMAALQNMAQRMKSCAPSPICESQPVLP
jgi:hypothetical protein